MHSLVPAWSALSALARQSDMSRGAPVQFGDDGAGAACGVSVHRHAHGACGMLLRAEDRGSGATFMLKVGYRERSGFTSPPAEEVDMCRLLWDLCGVTGRSWHVLRPLGRLHMVVPAGLGVPRSPACGTKSVGTGAGAGSGGGGGQSRPSAPPMPQSCYAFATEALRGVPCVADGLAPTRVFNLSDLIAQGMAGRVLDFDALLRAVLLQMFHTMTVLEQATYRAFRHNDLYAANVGLDWLEEEVTAHYVLNTPKAAKIGPGCFTLHTRVRAVMLDYGFAALVPKVGPQYDTRFFEVGTTHAPAHATSPAFIERDVLRQFGMSQRQPSRYYDVTLLTYSVWNAFSRALAAAPTAPLQPAKDCKDAFYVGLVEQYLSLWRSDAMCVGEARGRLTMDAQERLNQGPTSIVATAEDLMLLPYFTGLRSVPASADTGLWFGFVPSAYQDPDVCPPVGMSDASVLGAGEAPWRRGTASWIPPRGSYRALLEKLHGFARSVWQRKVGVPPAAVVTAGKKATARRADRPAQRPARPPRRKCAGGTPELTAPFTVCVSDQVFTET
jgi:hypothetical protein